ncbi:procollagen-lysine,2-oxoglutarate 5-dioxygenase 1 [Fistulifera solaris]|jgi:hypothetical protein|uniref:Procollagen-lysine,2-oxoglutarate 5-dioxygenase 1 n=1 Tax=Fistulifera solaris TaxID=1519565 RepID=A0A1Z5KM54_FISSO|nr:procollagen-lysine,2-oxoglutarate 5-dioxygenase 1 [Fistulifera solaris]|eukprot:GAX27403.1 procollagen-lysine,2-oxoglutarate 5-dioxygenase 1 [Fistulifera solaris]
MEIFLGEPYLQIKLPNYDQERAHIYWLLILSTFFWLILFPLTWLPRSIARTITPADEKITNNKKKSKQKTVEVKITTAAPPAPPLSPIYSSLGLVLSTIILLFYSPHNYFTSRQVFEAPLFTKEECQHVIQMAERAALQNYETASRENKAHDTLLMPPGGWQKTRHGSYPTTDLNLVTDPFTKEDRQWLSDRLDSRLAPMLSRVYGVPIKSLRAADMFLVRYDGDQRNFLEYHTDSGDISFNVLLNQDFEGGGTRFWNRAIDQPFAHVHPTQVGDVLAHSAQIHHEGYPVTNGTRIILVGFISVDNVDPFTGASTGLSWFASWGCLNWLDHKVRSLHNKSLDRLAKPSERQSVEVGDSAYMRGFFLHLTHLFRGLGDRFTRHDVKRLVAETDRDAYLTSLNVAQRGASWYKGQQIIVGLDGRITTEWNSRQNRSDSFKDL